MEQLSIVGERPPPLLRERYPAGLHSDGFHGPFKDTNGRNNCAGLQGSLMSEARRPAHTEPSQLTKREAKYRSRYHKAEAEGSGESVQTGR
jgi:hypothetical protein